MVLTPRTKFQENKAYLQSHQELVVSDRFRCALEASLVEMVLSMPMTYDAVEAAAAYNRIMGARDFVAHLLNIAEGPKEPKTPQPLNLDHSLR